MKLFNMHTHNSAEEFGIINLISSLHIEDNKQYSIGIHPWNYTENWENSFTEVSAIAQTKEIIAIGETGFDPKSKLNIEQQKHIFSKHIELSENLKKPLIIHCVKYYNELISLKKSLNPKQAWIIHGFRGKETIAKELIKHDFYFSINEDILIDTLKAEKIIKIISPERLFLETDDNNVDIRNIYNFAANIFNITIEELVNIISKNLTKCKIKAGKKGQNYF